MGINQQNYHVINDGLFMSDIDIQHKPNGKINIRGTYRPEHEYAVPLSKMDALMVAGLINETDGNLDHCIIESSLAEKWEKDHE